MKTFTRLIEKYDTATVFIGVATVVVLVELSLMRLLVPSSASATGHDPGVLMKQVYAEASVEETKNKLAQWSKLTEEQFMRFFNASGNKSSLPLNPNLTTEQIDFLYEIGNKKGGNVNVKTNLARYSKLTEEQFLRAFNDGKTNKENLAMNPSINPPANQQFASGVFNWRW